MRYGVVLDNAFTGHLTPHGHPERPERIETLINALDSWDRKDRISRYSPRRVDPEWILKVHSEGHYAAIKETAGIPECSLDPDTQTGPDSFETSLLAAGSGIRLAELLYGGEIDSGFLLCRPPGHHAESNRAMGFCLFNNVAIVAQWVIENQLASRIAIVDFDVHHGNGTQQIFYSRSDVLYVSSHQYPFYPGTGEFREMGEGPGLGYTLNFPLHAGTGDSFYTRVYREIVGPILIEFNPELILVSAGYDAHQDDPLGGMLLSFDGFEALSSILNDVSSRVADGRLLYVLEGGYNLAVLSDCVLRTVETALNRSEVTVPESQTAESGSYLDSARSHFARHWKCLN